MLMLGAVALSMNGCAHQPVFMDAQVEYPRLASRTCSGHTEPAKVDLVVRDAEGVALPGAVAYLLPMQLGPSMSVTTPVPVVTDSRGRATLAGTGGEPYAVTVVLAGFMPVSRIVLLEAGCRGTLVIDLAVALKYQ
jgi:hypothetical protein